MNWEDEGYLLSKRKFRENANIINVFTNTFGKVSGIVYGGNSRKIRNYLQISNKIFIFYTSKNENKIGYFKTELVEPISPKYFNDKKRSAALMSLTSLLNVLLPESQPYKNIYNSLEKLLKNFYHDQWIILFVYWELSLIKELGFDTNISQYNSESYDDNKLVTIDIDNSKYQIPSFLIKNVIPTTINNHLIKKSLIFTRSIMLNKFFLPNNLNLPKSRVLLENYFN
tara:strand:- start:1752 stop:2432 length:681 start_codon:yes stop_codon:yes gene_type:complete